MSLSLDIEVLGRCGAILFFLTLIGWLRHDISIEYGDHFKLGISPLYGVGLSIIFFIVAVFTRKVLFCYISAAFQALDIAAGLINRACYQLDSIYVLSGFRYHKVFIPSWVVEVVTWGFQVGYIASLVLSGTNSFLALLKKDEPQEDASSTT